MNQRYGAFSQTLKKIVLFLATLESGTLRLAFVNVSVCTIWVIKKYPFRVF